MSDWPLLDQYQAMLQDPEKAFRKQPSLQDCQITVNDQGLPKGIPGNFAMVFSGKRSDGQEVAIRVFYKAAEDPTEHYDAISEYLTRLTGSKRPRSIVSFRYHPKQEGITVFGKSYPMITMEWVPGVNLFDWVSGCCRNGDGHKLRQAADDWEDLVNELAAARIAHGDLQHGNVMVTPRDELKLVDYDGMCVPKLEGRPNLEIGMDPYQHPKRDGRTPLSPNLDNFSSLFILVALRALAAEPGMWRRFVEEKNYDKLLIQRDDLEQPDSSPLYQSLLRSSDKEVARLTQQLWRLYRGPLGAVPSLGQARFPLETLRSLLSQRKWDEAVQLVRQTGRPPQLPGEVQRQLAAAESRVVAREELERHVQAGDEAGMARCFQANGGLLSNYPQAAPAVAIARSAHQVLDVLRQLEAAKRAKNWRQFESIWKRNERLLKGRRSTAGFEVDAGLCPHRNRICRELLRLVEQPNCDVGKLKRLWQELNQLGGHADAEPKRALIVKMIERLTAWKKYQAVPQGESEDIDRQRVAEWNEKLFDRWRIAEGERARVQAAKARLAKVDALNRLIEQSSSSPPKLATEQAILRLASGLDPQYQYAQQPRVRTAAARISVHGELQSALAGPAPAAERITSAWQEALRLQGEQLLTAGERQRVTQAEQCLAAVERMRRIPAALPAQEYDAEVLREYDEESLGNFQESQPWREKYQVAQLRRRLCQQMLEALRNDDDCQVAQIAMEECMRGYNWPRDVQGRIQEAEGRVQGVAALEAALDAGDSQAIREHFDIQVLRRYGPRFEPYREKLARWIQQYVSESEEVKPGEPLARRAVTALPDEGSYLVYWQWPPRKWTDRCLLAVCPHPLSENAPPTDDALRRFPVMRDACVKGGGGFMLPADEELAGGHVVVWAVVDLDGLGVFYSPPLSLGRLPSLRPAKKRRWKLF